MTPLLLSLLFLSLTAVSPGAADDAPEIEVSLGASEHIESTNANTTTNLIFGDIAPNLRRNAVPCTSQGCTWEKSSSYVIVPVRISSTYTRAETNIIIRALLAFHSNTCIRFVWRRNQQDYLYFFSGSGCWSYLGRVGGQQMVSLQRNGCLFTDTVQHEVLHALGFHHEQVRSDRGDHVNILTENIQSGTERNFEKQPTNNLGTPYDFDSVMHYSKFAFSKNGQPTILAKDDPDLEFGRATEMSINDYARVNRLYQCNV